MGIPVAQFGLDLLAESEVTEAVANVHHLAPQTAAGLTGLDHPSFSFKISDESALLLGSGGGIRRAVADFGAEPFFILNADVLTNYPLRALAHHHQRLRDRWGVRLTLGLIRRSPGSGQYREIDVDPETSLITGLGELRPNCTFYSGAAVLESDALAELPTATPSDFVREVLAPAVKARKAGAFVTDALWYDVGSPELWLETHLDLMRRLETSALYPAWRRRIEAVNQRVGQQAWIGCRSRRPSSFAQWYGPAYWGGTAGSAAPERLGPRAVVYGEVPAHDGLELHSVIAYEGLISRITSSQL